MTLNRRRRRDAPTSKNDTFVYKRSVQVSFDVAVNEAGGVNSAFGRYLICNDILSVLDFFNYIKKNMWHDYQ